MSRTTIELEVGTAKALEQLATSAGLTVGDYLEKYVAHPKGGTTVDDADRWLDDLVDGLPSLTPLPADFSAKDAYQDRD